MDVIAEIVQVQLFVDTTDPDRVSQLPIVAIVLAGLDAELPDPNRPAY